VARPALASNGRCSLPEFVLYVVHYLGKYGALSVLTGVLENLRLIAVIDDGARGAQERGRLKVSGSCVMSSMQSLKPQDAGPIDADTLQVHLVARADGLQRYVAGKIPSAFATVFAAEDILQEVWIPAFRTVSGFRPTGPDALDRWLMSITNRRLADALKTAGRLKRGGAARTLRAGQNRRSSYADLFSYIAAPQKTPSRDASTREASHAIQIALSRLPDNRRRAIQMRYMEGRSRQEIARKMGKSVPAINGLLFHGLRELRERLGDAGRFFSDGPSSEGVGE